VDKSAAPLPPKRRRWLLLTVGVLLLIALAAVALFVLVFGDSPDEVSIEDATAQVDTGPQSASDPSQSAAPDDGGIEGSWTVDTTIGDFGFEDSTGSFVGFRVDEEFSGVGLITAVGRTPDVSGSLTIESDTVTSVAIEAGIKALVTDDSRRDTKALGALDVINFPAADFVLTEPISLPATAAGGDPIMLDAVGDLTVHGVTNPVTLALEARLIDGVVVVVGSTEIVFADYDVVAPSVSPPEAPFAITVEDQGILELQLFLSR